MCMYILLNNHPTSYSSPLFFPSLLTWSRLDCVGVGSHWWYFSTRWLPFGCSKCHKHLPIKCTFLPKTNFCWSPLNTGLTVLIFCRLLVKVVFTAISMLYLICVILMYSSPALREHIIYLNSCKSLSVLFIYVIIFSLEYTQPLLISLGIPYFFLGLSLGTL